ncbi:GNAT family N-acetyltransferase [Nostoc sphaeroides]|uniref:GNAT family N-acetyltransferase n=1 Tax=Nostoc sphaeroides CCNUC1 TaxID=2653204 RepID=A0A5P8VY84_9NOSO|nr:GNAT family N-acetyltransferase [Nostoc sphaeroides]QFS45350.1 GNAT family N-acetyltransferase [Nostoc sphaeroides CCNUC1]
MCEGSISVRQYSVKDFEVWDRFVDNSRNGTFLHTRKFLSHHGDKFQDVSLIFENSNGSIVGVFPAAIDIQQEYYRVVSHPGITYGGIVHHGFLRGQNMLDAFKIMISKYRQEGIHNILYKVIPYIYHQVPASDDLYTLFRLGAVCYRRDLSATIDIPNRPKLGKGRRYFLKKAQKYGVVVKEGYEYLEPFWNILKDNLANKYNAKPLHSLAEIQNLSIMFPDNIKCRVGLINSEVVAGTVIFQTQQVIHAQYMAASEHGRQTSALDLIIESWIMEANILGIRYFNFGSSTEKDGTFLNSNLYQYKSEFGAGGVVHEFYELSLI